MGIPVVDVLGIYSFAKAHPYWTALELAVLVALVWFVVWFTRKFPMHRGKLRLGLFVVYLAVALPMLWATFKTEPSQMSQIMDAAHQAHLVIEASACGDTTGVVSKGWEERCSERAKSRTSD